MRANLPGHLVVWAGTLAWGDLENGNLIAAAERNGFQVLVTADRNIWYQQNNAKRTISLVVLSTNYWPAIQNHFAAINAAILRSMPGSYEEVDIQLGPKSRPELE
jgi:hypothetical protein